MKYEYRFARRISQSKDGTVRLPMPLDISWVDKTRRGPGKLDRPVIHKPLPCEDLGLARRIAYGVSKNRSMDFKGHKKRHG